MPERTTLLVTGGTALIAGTYGLARYGFGLFLPEIQRDFALSSTAAGALGSAGLGSYCLAVLLAGALVARDRARLCTVAAGVSAALGCLGVAIAPASRPVLLGAAVLLAGLGAGLASVGLVHLVQQRIVAARAPRAQAVVNSGTGAGVIVAGVVALITGDAWRAAWAGFAVLIVIALLITLRGSTATVLADFPVAAVSSGASLRPLARPLLAALLLGVGSAAVWTFGRGLVVTRGGLDTVGSTLFWTALGAAGILGAATGDLVVRTDVRRAWLALAPVLAGSTAILATHPDRLGVALACGAAFGAAYVALTAVLIAWAVQLDPGAPGRGVAVLFGVLAAGQAIGAVAIGAATDVLGSRDAFCLAAVVAVSSCVVAVRPSRAVASVT